MNKDRNTTRFFISLGLWLLLAFIFTSCASTDQQGGDEDNYGNNYGSNELGDNTDGNDSESTNNASGNEYAESGASENAAEDGEGENYAENLNNDSQNEFDLGNQVASQQAATNTKQGNAEGYGEFTNNAEEPAEDLLADNGGLNLSGDTANPAVDAAAAPVNAAVDTPALDAPINVATPMPSSGGIVKYIRKTTNLLNSPNGQTVGTATKGDHPVVWEEGDFHRDARGRYMPSSAMSSSGVGRPREGGAWRSSAGGY